MKLKHLAAFLMLLAIGCTSQPGSESSAPAEDSGTTASTTESSESDATTTVPPETETQLATVSFNVTGMK